MLCDLCNAKIKEPPPCYSDDAVCTKCGTRYGYANGYRTLFLSREQRTVLKKYRKEWQQKPE